MKFLLVFSICSAITGFCYDPHQIDKNYSSWAECVGAGGELTLDFSTKVVEKINKNKLYISYTCYEIQVDNPT